MGGLRTFKVGVFDGHDACLGEELLGEVVDELWGGERVGGWVGGGVMGR